MAASEHADGLYEMPALEIERIDRHGELVLAWVRVVADSAWDATRRVGESAVTTNVGTNGHTASGDLRVQTGVRRHAERADKLPAPSHPRHARRHGSVCADRRTAVVPSGWLSVSAARLCGSGGSRPVLRQATAVSKKFRASMRTSPVRTASRNHTRKASTLPWPGRMPCT